MRDDDIELAKKWMAKAKNDLLNAKNNLASEKIPTDTVCFHFQQAAEKMLKAFLIAHGRSFPYSHDLLLLLNHVLEIHSDAEKLRDHLILLIPYAVEVRYPDDVEAMPEYEDMIDAKKTVEDVEAWLKNKLPEIFEENTNSLATSTIGK